MKLKIIIRVSKGISSDYFDDLKKVINSIRSEEKIIKEIDFSVEKYIFTIKEGNQILNNPNAFLDKKYNELSESQKSINSIIYVPDTTINLKGNFLWYSLGDPQQSVMVSSSFLYKFLIEGKLNFGAYILLIYSQFLARSTVDLKKSHRISKNCLNDFCTNQIEILNVFKNRKDVFCNECLDNIKNEEYHDINKRTVGFIEKNYYPKEIKKVSEKKIEKKVKQVTPPLAKKKHARKRLSEATKKLEIIEKPKEPEIIEAKQKKEVTKPEKELKPEELKIESKVEIEVEKGDHYEFEIYIAKKCANMAQLFEELGSLLSDPDKKIYGYSLYEVGGGYRDNINLSREDYKELELLREKALKNNVNDLIRPLTKKGNKQCAVYDETSIVLRIVVEGEPKIESLEEPASQAIREIIKIFNEISKNENSIYFTIKKLEKVAYIKRRVKSKNENLD